VGGGFTLTPLPEVATLPGLKPTLALITTYWVFEEDAHVNVTGCPASIAMGSTENEVMVGGTPFTVTLTVFVAVAPFAPVAVAVYVTFAVGLTGYVPPVAAGKV
jgi:hypothetical protein